jgi:hypothetical protein
MARGNHVGVWRNVDPSLIALSKPDWYQRLDRGHHRNLNININRNGI